MKRLNSSLRDRARLVRVTALSLLTIGALLAALFPNQIKGFVESLLPDEEPVARPSREVPEPSPSAAPSELSRPVPPPPSQPAPRVTAPPPATPPAGPPRIAVVGVGDPRIADRLGGLMVDALVREGVDHVENGGGSLRVRELLGRPEAAPSALQLAGALERDGFRFLVLAEGSDVATRQIEYYGRKENATKWRVQVSAYRLIDQRGVGPGWSGELEATERGVLAGLVHFLEPIAQQVASALDQSIGDGSVGR